MDPLVFSSAALETLRSLSVPALGGGGAALAVWKMIGRLNGDLREARAEMKALVTRLRATEQALEKAETRAETAQKECRSEHEKRDAGIFTRLGKTETCVAVLKDRMNREGGH